MIAYNASMHLLLHIGYTPSARPSHSIDFINRPGKVMGKFDYDCFCDIEVEDNDLCKFLNHYYGIVRVILEVNPEGEIVRIVYMEVLTEVGYGNGIAAYTEENTQVSASILMNASLWYLIDESVRYLKPKAVTV